MLELNGQNSKEIEHSINELSKAGWNENQINELLISFSFVTPEKFRTQISSLFHLLALIPTQSDLSYENSFVHVDYIKFTNLLGDISIAIEG